MPLWFISQSPTSDYVVLIVDDCQLAKHGEVGENPKRFFIALDYKDTRGLVTLGHGYIYPEDKPSTMTMSYPEILQSNPVFTSDVNDLLSWAKLKTNKKRYLFFSQVTIAPESVLCQINHLHYMK